MLRQVELQRSSEERQTHVLCTRTAKFTSDVMPITNCNNLELIFNNNNIDHSIAINGVPKKE
jgi:hypothetical protein